MDLKVRNYKLRVKLFDTINLRLTRFQAKVIKYHIKHREFFCLEYLHLTKICTRQNSFLYLNSYIKNTSQNFTVVKIWVGNGVLHVCADGTF